MGLMDELDEEAQKLKLQEDKRSKLKEEQKKWQEDDLAQFAIKGDEQEWTKSLAKNPKGVVSVKISSFSDCSVGKTKTERSRPGERRRRRQTGKEGQQEEEDQKDAVEELRLDFNKRPLIP